MLHRAANKAYSWWWASHIRTKQSKWLEENLHDVEDKIGHMLKIIEEDGDSFAQRAEMYYRRRPELIENVEETYRSYRALAERYDFLSKDLQRANRTIATVFPEQVQLAMDEEDDDNFLKTASITSFSPDTPDTPPVPKPGVPKVPFPKKEFKNSTVNKGKMRAPRIAATPSSGLSKEEALEEVDKLQKEILSLQTEKEFIRSSYERGCEKYWEIENQINEKQKKVFNLQDEFGIGSYIEDDEARNLMVSTALKSCQETLFKLQDEQQQSTRDAQVESARVTDAQKKFQAIRKMFNGQDESATASVLSESENLELDQEISMEEQDKHDLELLEKIKEQLDINSNSSLTMSQFADKIDELVQRVVDLESEVFSQNGMVKRLRSEADGLQAHVKILEEEKETLVKDAGTMREKMKEFEQELSRVKDLVKIVVEQNNYLKNHFAEASCNLDHLSAKLETVKMDEDDETSGMFQEKTAGDAKSSDKGIKNPAKLETVIMMNEDDRTITRDVQAEKGIKNLEENQKGAGNTKKLDDMSEKEREPGQENKAENKDSSETDEAGTDEDETEPNWRQLFLQGLDDREKILLEEYTSVLRDYKDVRKKLNDVEQKNRDGFFELAMQIRELKNAVASRDGEIQSLRKQISSPRKTVDEDQESSVTRQEGCYSATIMSQNPSIANSSVSSPVLHHETSLSSYIRLENETEESDAGLTAREPESEIQEEKRTGQMINAKSAAETRPVSAVEEKLRSDIDARLEENLEFWLRYSTCFHQIQKYQASIQDLNAEMSKLQGLKSGNPKSLASDARPIFLHLREIQTELTLWLENNDILQDEVRGRYSSLSNIQGEISRLTAAGSRAEDTELNQYQAAKFQGEILNMKQENLKVADQLKAGSERVKEMRRQVQKSMEQLDEEYKVSASGSHRSGRPYSRSRVPLRSFLFGVKLKARRQSKAASMFSCISPVPALSKQNSYIAAPLEPDE